MGCVGMAGRQRGTAPVRNVEEKRGSGMWRESSRLIGGYGLSEESDGFVFLSTPDRVRPVSCP
jgi:hypothetical protein